MDACSVSVLLLGIRKSYFQSFFGKDSTIVVILLWLNSKFAFEKGGELLEEFG